MKLKTTTIIILGFLIVFILGTAILFLFKDDSNFCLRCKIDTLKFSQFGGFLAGVLSSLSIFLLILTFSFNKESREIGLVESYYENLNKEIDSAICNRERGIEAYHCFKLGEEEKGSNMIDNINLVLTNFEIYLDLIKRNKLLDKKLVKRYINRFYLLYYAKLLWPLHNTIIDNGKTFIEKEKHDDALLILPKYAQLSIDCIDYLTNNSIVKGSYYKEKKIKALNAIITTAKKIEQTRKSETK